MASRKEIDKGSDVAFGAGTLPVNPFWTTDWGMVTVTVGGVPEPPPVCPAAGLGSTVKNI
jgi:hypothetical protein